MESISHRQVVCFLEVCRDFHFTKAAKRLGMAQPPLSRHIRELERQLGVLLFERTNRQVKLTAAGNVFLREVYQLPALLHRAVEGARRAVAGEERLLRIGFVGALMGSELWAVFERFRSRYADTQLSVEDANPSELLERVADRRLDGAFLGVRPDVLPKGVKALKWREEKVVVCFGRRHPLASRKRLRLSDLAGEPLVALSPQVAPSYRDFLDKLLADEGVREIAFVDTNGIDALIGMVVAGCGVAVLPESVVARVGDGVGRVPLAAGGKKLQEVFVYGERMDERFLACVKEF